MQFYEINICQNMNLLSKKRMMMIKIGDQTKEKLQVLSQVLE